MIFDLLCFEIAVFSKLQPNYVNELYGQPVKPVSRVI